VLESAPINEAPSFAMSLRQQLMLFKRQNRALMLRQVQLRAQLVEAKFENIELRLSALEARFAKWRQHPGVTYSSLEYLRATWRRRDE